MVPPLHLISPKIDDIENAAACVIQAAWRRYLPKKIAQVKHLKELHRRTLGGRGFGRANKILEMFTSPSNLKVYDTLITPYFLQKGLCGCRYYKKTFQEKSSGSSLFGIDRETVLVFGGIDPHTEFGVGRNTGKDVLRYQPEGNIWEHVGGMPAPRHHHSVAFFKGRVYVCGKMKCGTGRVEMRQF